MKNNNIDKILIVDDDAVQIKLLETILSQEGYEVVTSQEAAEGLQIAMNTHPDLIILDVMMPIINGFNFCKLLKDEKSTVPIILVTARDQKEDVEIGMEMGADAYLTKPIDTKELLKAIQFVQTMNT